MQEQHSHRSLWAVMAVLAGCGVVVLVVASSNATETLSDLRAKDDILQRKCDDLMSCSRHADYLARELIDSRLSLTEAARRLSEHGQTLEYNPLSQLSVRYPELREDARTAVKLIHAVSALLCDERDRLDQVVAQLCREFEQYYRVTLPAIHPYSSSR